MFSLTFIGNSTGVRRRNLEWQWGWYCSSGVHGGYEVIIRDLQMTLVQKGLVRYNSLKEKVQAHKITNEELELMKAINRNN